MGRVALIARLVVRDLRRRPGRPALLLLVIMAATTTLTMGLALAGVTSQPYQQTRAATAGPDVVASYTDLPPMPKGATPVAALSAMAALARAPGVTGYGGPYPAGWATLRTGKLTAGVLAEGRPPGTSAIDQPRMIQGSWVSPDGVVVERSFAHALGVGVGTTVTLDGRPFRVAGIAVSAADSPYPNSDLVTAGTPFASNDCGMIWVTVPVATSLASPALPVSYILNLRLADAGQAPAFAAAHSLGRDQILNVQPWQTIAGVDTNLVRGEQTALVVGSMLLGLLAVASVAVIVGGRMAEQTRRVGLLKAVGSTPALVATTLLTENLLLALAAAAAGLGAGWLAAPLLTSPGSGLVGTAGPPSLTIATAGAVTAVAHQILLVLTITLVVLAAIDAVFITQATATDARHSAALSRALGATPDQVAGALIVAQLLAAVPGALLGIPGGLGVIGAVEHRQGGAATLPVPSAWWLALMVGGLLLALATLTAIPARASARRPPAEILAAESVTG